MAEHDPGGKVRLALPASVEGGAELSQDGVHRYLLWRRPKSIETDHLQTILWVGMNPSTADLKFDDPTCAKEQRFSQQWGYWHYRKVNVMSYRCTDSKQLVTQYRDGKILSPGANLYVLLREAMEADVIVACWGKLHKELLHYAEQAIATIRKAHHARIWCLGLNKDGSPKHPLYIRGDAPLVPFPR